MSHGNGINSHVEAPHLDVNYCLTCFIWWFGGVPKNFKCSYLNKCILSLIIAACGVYLVCMHCVCISNAYSVPVICSFCLPCFWISICYFVKEISNLLVSFKMTNCYALRGVDMTKSCT